MLNQINPNKINPNKINPSLPIRNAPPSELPSLISELQHELTELYERAKTERLTGVIRQAVADLEHARMREKANQHSNQYVPLSRY